MRKFLDAKNTLSTFRYNSIINFLALTLTMSRHAVKVSNQQEGADVYGCVHSMHYPYVQVFVFVFVCKYKFKTEKYIIKTICDAF